MKVTFQKTSDPLPLMACVFLVFLLLLGFAGVGNGQSEGIVLKHSSGDDEIDQIRKAIQVHPTDESNYLYRASMLGHWHISLQLQGAITAGKFAPFRVNTSYIASLQNEEQKRTAIARYARRVDDGFAVLESIQEELIRNPSSGLTPLAPDPASVMAPKKTEKPWAQYMGNLAHTGFNGTDGPVYGRTAWKFPVGLAWESRPVIEDDKVFLTSPGVRNILFTLDINSGEIVDTVKKMPYQGSVYSNPAGASTPVVLKDTILVREMGSRGVNGDAKEVVYLSKNAGQVEKEVNAGHVDYRMGYAPLAANEDYMVYPYSFQDIEMIAPEVQAFNHVIVKDTKTGEQIRDIYVGHTFAEPLLDGEDVFVGTKTGYVYSFKASQVDEPHTKAVMGREQEVTWEFRAGGSVNRRVAADSRQVYFGANDGSVNCLDRDTGKLVWKYTTENRVSKAFRHFSTPLVSGNRIFIGSADKHLYCLDASSGKLIFKHASGDWIRARPVATKTNVYFASMNGELYNVDFSGRKAKEVWRKRIGDHWVYADLALSGDKLVLNDSDLYSFCIDTASGDVLWRFSILKGFHQEDDYRIFTDLLAGGGYYQSKPTTADGQVFIGTPSRFVYALDSETGEANWKFELGAAVSGSPVFDNNRIYIGQQGGEDDFYCLDAKTGELIWKQNLGWVWGSAAVSDGLVFVPGIDGYMNCLDAASGHIIWRHRSDKSVCSEPMVAGDYVYFGSWDTFLYKFEKRTGNLVWKLSGAGTDSGATIEFDGKLVLPGAGMTCVDAKTKEVLWKPELTGSTNGTPAYHDGQILVSMWGEQLIALDADTGKQNWKVDQAAGITAAAIGNNGYVFCGARGNPYFFAFDEKGNGDGTTDALFRVKMAGPLLESTPALYRGRAYILSAGGFLYAIE